MILNQLPLACLLLSSWEQMALEMELSGRLRAASSSNSKHRTLCWSCCSQANAFPGLPSHVLLPVILHATVSLKTTASTPPLCCVQQATPPPSRTSSSTVLVRKPQACKHASVLFLEAFLEEQRSQNLLSLIFPRSFSLAGGTRTCIHTPGANFVPEEMTQQLIDEILKVRQCSVLNHFL